MPGGGGGGGVLGFSFAGYVPLASQSPYPIIVYLVARYRPYLSHFWKNVIFAILNKSLSIYASTNHGTAITHNAKGTFILVPQSNQHACSSHLMNKISPTNG